MNVLLFPYWPENPYQPNLATSLKKNGLPITGVQDTSLQTLRDAAKDKDILHLHWTHPYIISPKLTTSVKKSVHFFRFLVRQKKNGKKIVWTIHNLGEHDKRHPVFELFCHRLIARLADGIIVHSQYANKKIVEVYRLGHQTQKIRVIPHGNYIGNYPNDTTCEQARKELGIGLDKKVFLFLGQMRSYKGLPELITAFSAISNGKEVLILAGRTMDVNISEEISKIIGTRQDILFHPGFIADEKLQTYMNAADAVVFPFRDIFTSGSVLLAMSFGKAIIIPNLDSLKEIIDYDGAITYENGLSEGLQAALQKSLLTDLTALGSQNLKAAKIFSWENIGNKTMELYSEIMGK